MARDLRPHVPLDRDGFAAELARRRAESGKSFAVLSRELDRPRSTLHGWCRGDHLPFPRDDDVFVGLLDAIGVDDPDPFLRSLRILRQRGRSNPYLGLRPFTEDDAERFHGRQALVDRLVAAVDDPPTDGPSLPIVVVGASGSGKTSLLRAGLVATLRRREGHRTAVVTPGDDPVERIERALTALAGAGSATLVVDQFEELFTLAAEEAVDDVVACVAGAQRARIQVVIGVRADFFHHVAAVPLLLAALDRRQVVVGPMTTGELTEAIVTPAGQAGLRVAPDLLAHLLREFDGHAHRSHRTHTLPLLSHVLFQLAETVDGTVLGLSDYLAAGGLTDALQRTADETLAGLRTDLHATCRELFLQLVELRSDTTPTRRRATWEALGRIGVDDDVRAVLDAFVRRRLLTTDHDTVTLTHEALITAWPTLAEWVDGQREELLVRRRVRTAHRTWRETGRPVDGLLRGSLLDEALHLVDGPLRSTLADDEVGFVDASRRERAAAAARDAAVLSRQIAAQSELLAARDPSLSRHLALEAHAVDDNVESRSAVLRSCAAAAGPRFVGPAGPAVVAAAPSTGRAIAAFHADGLVERYELVDGVTARAGHTDLRIPGVRAVASDATGRRAAYATRDGRVGVVAGDTATELPGARFDGAGHAVAMSPGGDQIIVAGGPPGVVRWREQADGWAEDLVLEREVTTLGLAVRWSDGLMATAADDGVVSLWDRDGAALWSADPLEARPVASTVAISPDGLALAAGYHDGSVRIWCLGDLGAPTEQPLGSAAFATWVNSVEFSPDGRMLAAASSDGSVRLWDTASWRELRTELRHPSVVSGVRFVAGRTLVTSSEDGIVRTWDVSRALTGSDASVWSLDVDDDGARLVAASRTMLTIDRGDGPRRTRQAIPAPADLQMLSGTCAIDADGRLIAAGTRSGDIWLVEGANGEPLGHLRGELGPIVESVAVLDGPTVVGADSGGRLHRWRLDDDLDVVESAGCVVSAGTALGVADVGAGRVAVTTEPGELVVVDVSQREPVEVARFRPGDAFPICVAPRPGHPTIVTGGADRAVSVWSVEDWTRPVLEARLVGPAGHVMTVDVDRTGRWLAAGTTDGRIWCWSWPDASPDDQLEAPVHWATIETGEAGVYAVRFTPDGRYLVSAGPNHRVTWWPLDVDAATVDVERRLGDPLTDDERGRLVPATHDVG